MANSARYGTLFLVLTAACRGIAAEPYFAIQVVDEATGRGVSLVELKTVNQIRLYTDSNGIVAFHEPGLMDRDVFFHVRSHGYEFPRDGFGFAGKSLKTTPGGMAILKLRRINLAERLYRVTGGGIYRDSLLVGEPVPLREPVLNAQVVGSDSVANAVYRGRIYWFWGDTHWPAYPLGNFHVPGATSELPEGGKHDPARGIELNYFTDDHGFAKPTAEMPGPGPTWIEALVTLSGPSGVQMFAAFAKVKPPLTIYQRGLAVWDDEAKRFERVVVFPENAPLFPHGHPFPNRTGGDEHIYFSSPYPIVRVRATADDLRDASRYEAYTCLRPGSSLDKPELDRDAAGRLRWSWKRDAPAIRPEEEQTLIRAGTLKPDEALLRLTDRDTGQPVLAHRGSVYWNAWRKRWVMIAVQSLGTSALGEVWYSEADTPTGPWGYAVKVATHDRYSFYNPKQHPMLDQDSGRTIYFEGTYTRTFSGNPEATPRYDYNQILYRLDLGDSRLAIPVPFAVSAEGVPRRLSAKDLDADGLCWDQIAFFAPDRAGPGTVPILAEHTPSGRIRLRVRFHDEKGDASPLFHAPERPQMPETATALWEFRSAKNGEHAYSVDPEWSRDGFTREKVPLCFVWGIPGVATGRREGSMDR